jgi:hypothetical protein
MPGQARHDDREKIVPSSDTHPVRAEPVEALPFFSNMA